MKYTLYPRPGAFPGFPGLRPATKPSLASQIRNGTIQQVVDPAPLDSLAPSGGRSSAPSPLNFPRINRNPSRTEALPEFV